MNRKWKLSSMGATYSVTNKNIDPSAKKISDLKTVKFNLLKNLNQLYW